jgi:holliday junction DNA helicase RuvA
MFAKLKGILDSAGDDTAVIDVNGVGYLVSASRATLGRLGPVGSAVSVLIETHVREDKIALYAFASAAERDWFRQLYSVQGVGPKVALSILSALPPDTLATALMAGDAKLLTRADGVGPKLATRIVTELKSKVADLSLPATAATPSLSLPAQPSGALADAVSALVNLGYGRAEAFTAVAQVKAQLGEGADVSSLIRAGLKELSA